MKKRYLYLTVMLLSALLYSCKKNGTQVIDKPLGNTAQIKYFNFGANAPAANIYANNVKLTALAVSGTNESGIASGGVYPVSNYSVIDPGNYTFKAQLPSTLTTDANLAISNLTATVESGKYYSLYLSGVYNTTAKISESFIIEDVLPPVDYSTPYIRFVNAVSNGSAGFSLYAKNTVSGLETLIATSIAYKAGSTFITLPVGVYELYVRYASAPTVNVISRNGTSVVSFAAGKAYTIGARGDMTVTSTTAANRPQLDNTANR